MIYRYFADRGGWRFVVLFHNGRKWLKALDTSTFEVYRLPVRELSTFVPYQMKPATLANRLRKRRSGFKRCNVHFSERAVQTAINNLKSANNKKGETSC